MEGVLVEVRRAVQVRIRHIRRHGGEALLIPELQALPGLVRVIRLPIIQKRAQGLGRVDRGEQASLILVVQTVATGAGADFTRLEGHPIALLHHTAVGGIRQVPGQRPLGRYDGGHGSVIRQMRAAGEARGIRRIFRNRVVPGLRHHPAARHGGQPAKAVGLEELQVGDLVNGGLRAHDALGGGVRDLQVIRLLLVNVVAGGDIPADDE